MDPISASCCNLNQENLLRKPPRNFQTQDILNSTFSLSQYEERNFKNLKPQIFAAIMVTSYHVIVGIALAYSAIIVPQLEESSEFPMTKNEASWIASVTALTTPMGGLLVGILMDKYGRLNTLQMATIPGIAGWLTLALARNIHMVIIGRALVGFASALGTNPAIVYLTEIARKDMRGSLISFAPALTSLGMVLTFLMGWHFNWRAVAWCCTIVTLIPAALVFFIPESPSWLISQGRTEDARKSLAFINRHQPQPINTTKTFTDLQLTQLLQDHEYNNENSQQEGTSKFREFLKPTGYKPLLILAGVFFFQQFSGIFIFIFYSIAFFQEVGSNGVNPYFASIFIGILRFFMCLINTYSLKTFHRRPLVMISFTAMGLAVGGSALSTQWVKEKLCPEWVPVVCLLMFVAFSMVGVVSVPYTMSGELFPLEIRGVSNSIILCVANLFMFAGLQLYPVLYQWLGGLVGVQWVFAGVNAVGILFVYLFLPETHEKKLSEIQEYFRRRVFYICGENKEGKGVILTQDVLMEES